VALPKGPTARLVWMVMASTTLSGCFLWTTRGEGDTLLQESQERDERITQLEAGAREERERLEQELERARTKIAELEQVLERATRVVTRNSADLGAEVAEIRQQIAALEGSIAEVRNTTETNRRDLNKTRLDLDKRLDVLARRSNIDQPVPEAEIPSDAGEHFQTAYRAHQGEEYARARSLFREFIRRYAEHDDVDNAHYWIGQSYLQQDRPASALGALRQVISQHRTGDAHDEALFAMADAFYRLHACTDARTALEALIQGHADSPLLRQAQIRLRQIRRPPRGHCTS